MGLYKKIVLLRLFNKILKFFEKKMSEKSINYLARDFNGMKSELIKLSRQYYPELADSFNDASVGSWFIDLVSAVGDDLGYYIDRCYNEQNVNSAHLKGSVLNFARMNNFKVPGPKAAMCEVAISVDLPPNNEGGGVMSQPDWSVAPKIKQGAVVTNGSVDYEIMEDIDFKEQFNKDAVSNRRFVPLRDTRGAITSYRVTKTVLATSGRSRIYKKLLTQNDIKPYMEVLIPFKNVMNIEGVIFKTSSSLNIEPDTFQFYVNAEEFQISSEDIMTYRYFEVESLSDQYIFDEKNELTEGDNNVSTTVAYTEGENSCEFVYPYKQGVWKPITQKFITEYTDSGYIKLIFGSGFSAVDVNGSSETAKYILSKIANNELTGILPQPNWVMYVLYRDGGGQSANIAPNSLNKLSVARWEWSNEANPQTISQIKGSVRVKNTSPGISGVDAPSVNDVKYLTKYNSSAQSRCVTVKDYELRVKMMPSKYGAPYKCKAIEDNNKILIYMLGVNSDGSLSSTLPDVMLKNVKEYLSMYKTLGDIVELRSASIYNIKVDVFVSISKTYNKQAVVKDVINTVAEFFDVTNHTLGEDIYIGELEKEISSIDGVVNFEKIYIASADNNVPLPKTTIGETDYIDLEGLGKTLSCDAKGMFEIKEPKTDITIKVKTI